MNTIRTLVDLESYVTNGVPEGLHLDYKRSESLLGNNLKEISKDVSAFANADGGTIIYGIEEKNHAPVRLDEGNDGHIASKERIEAIMNSTIAPKLPQYEIMPIRTDAGRFYYVIYVEKSNVGPHQDTHTKKYYKRFNFSSEPMEHYEIEDIRNRRTRFKPLVNVDIKIEGPGRIDLLVENIGDDIALNLTFKIVQYFDGLDGDFVTAPAISRGLKAFQVGRRLLFHLGKFSFEQSKSGVFEIAVEYTGRGSSHTYNDSFIFDFLDYKNSLYDHSEYHKLTTRTNETLTKIRDEIGKFAKLFENYSDELSESGLTLSRQTAEDLEAIGSGTSLPRLSPYGRPYTFFRRLLDVDVSLAYAIMQHFQQEKPGAKLSDLPGMTEGVLEKFRRQFNFEGD